MSNNYRFSDEDRNKFLVEAMDEDFIERDGKDIAEIVSTLYEQDFDTWDGFGHLLEWAVKEDWWEEFIGEHGLVMCKDENSDGDYYLPVDLLKPDKFADAIQQFLESLEDREGEGEFEDKEDTWKTQ